MLLSQHVSALHSLLLATFATEENVLLVHIDSLPQPCRSQLAALPLTPLLQEIEEACGNLMLLSNGMREAAAMVAHAGTDWGAADRAADFVGDEDH